MLVHTPDGNISRCMRHVNGVYTQRFNRRHKTDGQLFRGRYKAILVDGDSYLLELLRYIHRNPIRAGLAKTLEQYSWCSHRGYISGAKKWDWLYKDFLLSMFSDKKRLSMKAYLEFVQQKESHEIIDFFGKKNLPSVLGTDDFKEWVKERFQHLKFNKEISGTKILAPEAAGIKGLVCKAFRVKEESFSVSKRGARNMPRDIAIYLLRRFSHETLSSIGQQFCLENYSSVSSANERIKRQLRKDAKLRKKVGNLERKLAKSQRQT